MTLDERKVASVQNMFNMYLKSKTKLSADTIIILANDIVNAGNEAEYDSAINDVQATLLDNCVPPFKAGDRIKYKLSRFFRPNVSTGIVTDVTKGAYPGLFNVHIRRDDGTTDVSYPGDIELIVDNV